MKKILKPLIISLIIVITITISLIISSNYLKERQYKYKITYHNNYIPETKYEILVLDNYDMLVKAYHFCTSLDCEIKENKYKVTFSKQNKLKLKLFLKDILKNNKELTLEEQEIKDNRTLNIIESIIYNEETTFSIYIDYNYKIIYQLNNNEYHINFKSSNIIEVFNIYENKDNKLELKKHTVTFSKENTDKILNMQNVLFNNTESNEYIVNEETKEEYLMLINALINNDQTKIEGFETDHNLLFTIKYDIYNCKSGILKIYHYQENKYSYEYIGNEIKINNLEYNINDLINSTKNQSKNDNPPYTLQYQTGEIIEIYDNNKELKKLLKEINVPLGECLN